MYIDRMKTLYDDISREGFKTSWTHPQYGSTIPGNPGKEFFVTDLPVKQFAPFDHVYAHIYFRDGRIACCLTFIFVEEFKDCITGEECTKEINKHYIEWNRACHEHFGLISDYFALEWEFESIVPESDNEACELIYRLDGAFDINKYTRIRTLLLEVRAMNT